MKKFLIIIIIFLLFTSINAQDIKFFGEAKPGNIVFAIAENIEYASLEKVGKSGSKKKLLFDKNGNFIFGFDAEAEGKYVLRVKQKGIKEKTFIYEFEKIVYEKQKLSVASKYVTPPKRFAKKIAEESIKMKRARAKTNNVKEAYYLSGFRFPVDSVTITSDFGLTRILNGKPKNLHNGLDFRGGVGAPVYAISDGIVRLAAENFYYNGTFVLLDHGQGLTSVYLHFSKLNVKTGDRIKKGDLIGEVGSTGRSTGPHLHLGIQWYNNRIDPNCVLGLKFE